MAKRIFNHPPQILEGLEVWRYYLSTQNPSINTLQNILRAVNKPQNSESEFSFSEQVKGHIENVKQLVNNAILRQNQSINLREIGNEEFQREDKEEEHTQLKKLHQERRKERASHEGKTWREKQQAKEKTIHSSSNNSLRKKKK